MFKATCQYPHQDSDGRDTLLAVHQFQLVDAGLVRAL
jgi:hypothetical protein